MPTSRRCTTPYARRRRSSRCDSRRWRGHRARSAPPSPPRGARRHRRACRPRRCRRRRRRCRGRERRSARSRARDAPASRLRATHRPAACRSCRGCARRAARHRTRRPRRRRCARSRAASPARHPRGHRRARRARGGRGWASQASARPRDEPPRPRPTRPGSGHVGHGPRARLTRAVEANPEEHQQGDRDHHRDDEHVGHVVNRGHHPRRVDEVDDMTDREAGLAEEPVGEVAEDAAEQQAQHDRPAVIAHAHDGERDDDQRGEAQDDREHPGDALAERKRGAGVSREIELQEVSPHLHGPLIGQVLQGEMLRELVDGQHHHREDRDDDAGRRGTQSCAAFHRPAQEAETDEPEVAPATSRSRSFFLDEAAQLRAVVALELTQLTDAGLEGRALGVETCDLVAALRFGVGDDRGGLRLCVGDELVALGLALGDVLVVQALRELDDACGGGGATAGRGGGSRSLFDDGPGLGDRSGLDHGDRGRGGGGLELGDTGLQLLRSRRSSCATRRRSRRGVVDLIRVEALLEADVLELLGDDVFGGQSHGVSSFSGLTTRTEGRPAFRGPVLEQHSPHTRGVRRHRHMRAIAPVIDSSTNTTSIVRGNPRSRAIGPSRSGGMSRRKKRSGGSVTV